MEGSNGRLRLWWLSIPALTAGNQACMKLLAMRLAGTPFGLAWFLRAFHTPWLLGVIVCEIVGFVLWMKILSTVNISRALPLSAISYFLILGLSWFGFHEPINAYEIVGTLLILAGLPLIASG